MNKHHNDLYQKFLDILSFRDLADGTISTYCSYLTQFLDWFEKSFPDRPVDSVTWEELRSFVKYLKEVRKLNPRTVNVYIAQLRDFFQYTLHRDWDRYQLPYLRFDEKLPNVPTKDQINQIIDSISNPKHKAEIALLYSSGIRVSELCRLHCEDIYHSKNSIYVSPSKNRSDRYAVLSEKAYRVLLVYIRSSYPGAKKADWLFPGQKQGTHICEQSVANVFQKQLKLLGLSEEGYSLHSLRHGFGLHLYEAGTDLMTIKEAMGHKSLSSTETYLRLGIGNGRSVKSPYDI